jgi:addiction module RelE/StbE family toxin
VADIHYSEVAKQDLEDIGDYIAKNLKSPLAALHTVNRILDAIDVLLDFPSIGTPLSAHHEDANDYRFLVCGNHLVFYHERDGKVHIDRVLYGKRDYISILLGSLQQ